MKVVFMGTPVFSVPVLEGLLKEYNVVGVVTQPDKPVGRKKVIKPTPIKEFALKNNIKVLQPVKIRKDFKEVLELEPDIIITAAYGQFIPNEILDYPKFGCVNVHASLLPKFRGGSPMHKAITTGEKETGITIMFMGEKMDAGDIISQEKITIEKMDTVGSIHDKLSILGRDLLLKTLPIIFNGNVKRIKQNEDEVTFAFNIKREEERINWNKTSIDIYNHIRGFNPWPLAYTKLDGVNIKIFKSRIHDCINAKEHHIHNENGEIVKIFKNGIGVKVSDGILVIEELQVAGKKRMTVDIFMNGMGKNLITLGKKFI